MKQVVLYKENRQGKIAKFIDGVEVVEGVVVNEGHENEGFWSRIFGHKSKPFNDNGREYNPASGNWEYTAEANGNADPCQCNYEAPQDYQGSVPVWDGYSGES